MIWRDAARQASGGKRDNPLSSATPSELMSVYGDRGLFDEALVHPRAAGAERHLAPIRKSFSRAVIGRLFDRIDQAVQFDRGLKGGLAAFAGLDSLGEQRVTFDRHCGFAGWRTGRRDGEALRHRQQRERIVAFSPRAVKPRPIAAESSPLTTNVPFATIDFHAIAAAGERDVADLARMSLGDNN